MIYLHENGVTVVAKSSARGGEMYELNDMQYYVAVDQWDLSYLIHQRPHKLSELKKINFDLNRVVTSKVTTMNGIFSDFSDFNDDISSWDTSKVKSMSEMFKECEKFNQPIGDWNTKNVTAMLSMFEGAKSFNQPIGNWDTGKLQNISNMFENAVSFNQPLENWNIDKITNMLFTFKGATSFNQSLSKWNIGHKNQRTPRMFSLFEDAKSFNGELKNWNPSGSLLRLFKGAKSFNQPLDSWKLKDVDNVKSLFEGAESFNQDISDWDTSNFQTTESMFCGATSFNSDIGKWNVSSLENMDNMFKGASNFNQDISRWDVSKVKKMVGLFQDAICFNQDISQWKLNSRIKKSRNIFLNATAFDEEKFSPFNSNTNVKVVVKKKVDTGIKLISGDQKAFSKIKTLLLSRDFDKIDLGIDLLISLDNIQLFEKLLFGCMLTKNSNQHYSSTALVVKRSPIFTGSAQPYLDNTLFKIIANTPQEAKIDETILLKNINSFDSNMLSSHAYSNPPMSLLPFNKFSHLEFLKIDFNAYDIGKINLEDTFRNENVTSLEIKNFYGSLKWLKNFSQLKTLKFNDNQSTKLVGHYESFKYLINLEELEFGCNKLDNFDFLSNLRKLKKLSITNKYQSEGNGDVKLLNLDFLYKLSELEEFDISELESFTNLNGLIASKNLKKLRIELAFENADLKFLLSCIHIKELYLSSSSDIDLKYLKNCKALESLRLLIDKKFSFFGNISEIDGIKELGNLRMLSVGSKALSQGKSFVEILGLNNGNLMIQSDTQINESLKFNNQKRRVDYQDLYEVKGVMYYYSLPFDGIVFYKRGDILFHEYEMSNGLSDGIFREFYSNGAIKLELKFKGGEIIETIGFYDNKGKNVLEGRKCTPASLLEIGEDEIWSFNDRPFSGLCFLEIDTFQGYENSISELLNQYHWVPKYNDPGYSIILEIKNGAIAKNISIAKHSQYAKLSIIEWSGSSLWHSKHEIERANLDIINDKEFLEKYNVPKEDDEKSIHNILSTLYEISVKKDVRIKSPLANDQKKLFSEIKKLLSSRDFDNIDEGIKKLVLANNNNLFEILLDDCHLERFKISEGGGYLKRNKFFKGSGPAQPYLNWAFFSVIAYAPQEAKIDNSLLHKNISFLNMGLFFDKYDNCPKPPIDKFTWLTSLEIDLSIYSIMNHGPVQGIEREDWFINNNITELTLNELEGSLKWMKNFRVLKSLKVDFGYYPVEFIESFVHLENLEELSLSSLNKFSKIENLDFLKNCKKLKKLKLQIHSLDKDLKNIDIIKKFNELEDLEIMDVDNNLNLDFLLSCRKLKKLSISTSFNLELLKNCKALECLFLNSDSMNLIGNILDIDGLQGLNNLRTLSFNQINISGLNNKILIK